MKFYCLKILKMNGTQVCKRAREQLSRGQSGGGIRRLSRKDMEGVLRVSIAVKRHCDHSNISKENGGSDLQVIIVMVGNMAVHRQT